MKYEDLKVDMVLECILPFGNFEKGGSYHVEMFNDRRVVFHGISNTFVTEAVLASFDIPRATLEEQFQLFREFAMTEMERQGKEIYELKQKVESAQHDLNAILVAPIIPEKVEPVVEIRVTADTLAGLGIFANAQEPISVNDFRKAGGHGRTWNYMLNKGLIRHTSAGSETNKILFRRTKVGNRVKSMGLHRVQGGEIIQYPKDRRAKAPLNAGQLNLNGTVHAQA